MSASFLPPVWHDSWKIPGVESSEWKVIQAAFDAKLFHRGVKAKVSKSFSVNRSAVSERLLQTRAQAHKTLRLPP
jgi:hypothetical protein